MTMVVVTHEIGFAKEVATDVVFIDDGVIKEKNNPQEFFNNPQDDRLKEFYQRFFNFKQKSEDFSFR